uniref:Uncharacterized protein n=1 Tax=Aegilops tauschii TaxID=37682 RepID=M8CT55_AEGTA
MAYQRVVGLHVSGRKSAMHWGNFAPVEEIGDVREIFDIAGEIPADFPEGVYIRNGSNPLFGALHSSSSIFGKSHDIWIEGEGMLHAVYFTKSNNNTWSIKYTNRYVQSDTFRVENGLKKPCFLPATDGDPLAMLIAGNLNTLRFGKAFKNMSNTSVFEHAGRVFSAAENDNPHEIDLYSLGTLGSWNVDGGWKMPFTAHPKVIRGTGELVIFGFNVDAPFLTVGVVSEISSEFDFILPSVDDGKKLQQKVALELDRCTYCHEIGVTTMYNIILDSPLTINKERMLKGALLIEFEKDSYARIGVMPHYGDANSITWFYVQPFCTIHLVNCFEEDDENSNRCTKCNGKGTLSAQVLLSKIPPKQLMLGRKMRGRTRRRTPRTPRSRSKGFTSHRGESDWWNVDLDLLSLFPQKLARIHGGIES